MTHTNWRKEIRCSLCCALLCVSPLLALEAFAGHGDNRPSTPYYSGKDDVATVRSMTNVSDSSTTNDGWDPIHPWDNNDFADSGGTNGVHPQRREDHIEDAGRTIEGLISPKATRPEQVGELNNFPNPFNAQTNIRFTLAVSGNAEIEIFNLLGQSVRKTTLTGLSAGAQSWTWDGRAGDGPIVPSGIYFYRVISGSSSAISKMVLLK